MKRTHTRLLSLLLCLAMILSVLPMAAYAAQCALDSHEFVNGFCTDCDAYQSAELADGWYEIGNAGQLYWFASQVNSGDAGIRGRLTGDIVVNSPVLTAEGSLAGDGSTFRVWTPIGSNEETAFSGTFDGAGNSISGLYFDDSAASYVGLFGYVDGGKVLGVGVADSYLSGDDYVGGVVGAGDFSTIEDCHSAGIVIGDSNVGGVSGNSYMGSITGCVNTCSVSGSSYVGGVLGTGVGYTVERCGNDGSVSGSGSRVGGVAGNAGGVSTIDSCYNTAALSGNDYVGGVLGNQSADTTLSGSFNTGTIDANGSYVGGVVGLLAADESGVTGCLYLSGCAASGIGGAEGVDPAEPVDADRFASGEIAYLLNGSTDQGDLVWYQTIGTDPSPRFTGQIVYLATQPCPTYSNSGEVTVKEHVGAPATCTEAAVCEVCGEVYMEALGHSYESVVTEPTCTEDGYTTHTCTGCGDSYVDSPVAATGHSWLDATCTEARTCSVCGATEGEALGHSYESAITDPTCTEDGYAIHTCTVCGDSYEEILPTTGHSWADATCMAPKTCTACGLTEGEVADHSYKSVVTDPTCTADGYTTHTCTGCGDSYVDSPVAATGHSWRAATCSAPKTCAICGKTEGEVLGHDYDRVVTAPTCTEAGFTTYTCAVCGHSYTDNYTDALGHTYDSAVVAPTCTEAGYTVHTCTVCGHSYQDAHTNALGHDYQEGICNRCGDVQLTAPTILSCYSKLRTSVKVTWSAVDNADGYELWRSTTPDDYGSWIRVKTMTDGASTIYTNQGLTEGVTYYYSVRAFITLEDGSRVYSGYSDMDYMPAAVVFDGPYSNATDAVRLRWNEVVGSHGYQIWRLNEDGTYSIVKTLGDKGNELTDNKGSVTAYTNTGLTSGDQYTYKMRAFMISEDGRKVFGAYSDEFTVAVMPEAPVASGTSPKAGRAQLSWDAVSGAAGYQIWMSTSADGDFSIVKSITDGTATSYTKYDLVSGETYYFKIRAYVEIDGKKTFGASTEVIAVTIQ